MCQSVAACATETLFFGVIGRSLRHSGPWIMCELEIMELVLLEVNYRMVMMNMILEYESRIKYDLTFGGPKR